MVACGFSTLVPALVFSIQIFQREAIGLLPIGYSFYVGQSGGTLKSVQGYEVVVNANLTFLDDFSSGYGDGSTFAVTPRGLLITEDNVPIGVQASGIFANTTHIAALLSGKDKTPQKWGESYSASTWTFDVSKTIPKYRALGDGIFVGNFRLSPGNATDGSFLNLEYRLSKITPGPLENGTCSVNTV